MGKVSANRYEEDGRSPIHSSLKRAFDPDVPLFIDYEDNLDNHAGTDRAPVEHEAVRY